MLQFLQKFWQVVRRLSGDDAYERYCAHHHDHAHVEPLLNRREFYVRYQHDKWNGVKRCC